MEHIDRQAARLLVVTPEEQVLLLRLEPSFRDPFWVTPGGGLDDGESFVDAARRELDEEVGRDDLPIGPCIWRRTVTFTWERWRVQQEERTFLVETPAAFEAVTVLPDEEPITGSGWFTILQLARARRGRVSGRPRRPPRAVPHERRAGRADRPRRRGRGLTCRRPPLRSPDARTRDRRLADRVPRDAAPNGCAGSWGAIASARATRSCSPTLRSVHTIGMRRRSTSSCSTETGTSSGVLDAPPGRIVVAATQCPSHRRGRGRARAGVHFSSRRKNHSRCSRQRPSGANRRWITPSYSTRIGSPTFCVITCQWTKATSPSTAYHLVGHRDLL